MAETKKTAIVKPAAKETTAKTADTKTAEVTTTSEASVAKTEPAAAPKKEETKKTTRKTPGRKATTKKAAAKKEPAKRTAAAKKAEVQGTLHVEFAGKSYTTEDLVKIAKDVWQYDLNRNVDDFKSVEMYVKPEESVVYYVINGEVKGSFGI